MNQASAAKSLYDLTKQPEDSKENHDDNKKSKNKDTKSHVLHGQTIGTVGKDKTYRR